MGDRVRVQFAVQEIYLGREPATQVNSAWPSLRGGTMSTSQTAETPCGWGVKRGEDYRINTKVRCTGAHPLYRRFEPARVTTD